MDWPPYCCVILVRPPGEARAGKGSIPEVFCEVRSAIAAVQPGSLTCFGGKLESEETPAECIARECQEELGWVPDNVAAQRVCDLYVNGKLMAWFFFAHGPRASTTLTYEKGTQGRWIHPIDEPLISHWHSEVFQAVFLRSENRVDINDKVAASSKVST
eukprot:m.18570 g.18570  ORF g.18570 m.18570 type:complete len:159 (-) comp5334_c0_seq1:320-796(-)